MKVNTTLKEVFGTDPKQCPHDKEGSSFHVVVPGEGLDFFHACRSNSIDYIAATSVRVCDTCFDTLPSRTAQAAASIERQEAAKAGADEETQQKVEAHHSGDPLFQCPSCDQLFNESELVLVRECPHCESTFNGTDNGRNCETCNRPFTRKLTEAGCPECLDEAGCTPLDAEAIAKLEIK